MNVARLREILAPLPDSTEVYLFAEGAGAHLRRVLVRRFDVTLADGSEEKMKREECFE